MDDIQEKLKTYISQQLQTGQTPDEIAGQLSASGWPPDHIQAAFIAIHNQTLPSTMQPAAAANTQAAPASAPRAAENSRGRIKTGWILFKQSMKILHGNKY